MNDEDKIKAVTAKLTHEFYVGQRVRLIAGPAKGTLGTVKSLSDKDFPLLTITLSERPDDYVMCFPHDLDPA